MGRSRSLGQVLPRLVTLVLAIAFLCGCAVAPSPDSRVHNARVQAEGNGWAQFSIPAGAFRLTAFHAKKILPQDKLTVYIEGDGFAWISSSQTSSDPTPINPTALGLALAHPAGNAAYLARPCQYSMTSQTDCAQRYWTNARFAPEVVAAMNAGVDQLKATFRAREISLVGYSGGGAMAALIAARRDDVADLVTVAANLDHRAWTSYHRLSPLTGSLNAADFAAQVAHIPQIHFIGEKDKVIPPSLARQWPVALSGPQYRNLQVIPSFDHVCCWQQEWAKLVPKS